QISPQAYVFPTISPSGYSGLMTEVLDGNFADIHSFYGTVSKSLGSHMLRVGSDLRINLVNNYSRGYGSGQYSFGSYLNGPFDNSPAAPRGAGVAGLLLGLPTGGGVDVNDSYAARTSTTSVFVQDDWKVTRKLTVNLGLRYEYEGPIVERYNRSVRGFDYNAASPIEPAAVANYNANPLAEIPAGQFRVKGGLTYAGVNGQPNSLYNAPTHGFMPRVGFAYQLGSLTVLRGGYGIFFDQIGIATNSPIQTGFNQNTAVVPTLDNGVTFRATLDNPFPDGLLRASGASGGLSTFLGRSINFFVGNPRMPYNQRWSFGVQRQLSSSLVFQLDYVGSRGTALQIPRQIDGTPNQYLSTLRVRDQATIDRLSANVPNPFYPLLPGTDRSGTTVSRSQLLVPYPQFSGITINTNDGYSWYHSMQTRVEKRFSAGYTLMGAWTWSKNMEAVSFLNPMDTRPERVISANDRTHRIVINGIYELPFGRGRRFGSSRRGATGQLISGWQIDGIWQIQSGDPLGLGDFIYSGDPTAITLSSGDRRPEQWFNTAGFERDTRKALASNIRYQPTRFSGLRADRITYLDLSAIKKVRITETISCDIRAEFINALNHPVFEPPDTNPYSTAFGTVTAAKQLPRTIQFGIVGRF
ncbi:MAG TPA: TonB-dependent receptor, partial [Bryobacteraceae bacterium]|nr:TonB-dependent receptor [Bryobacteraceae bacterium]